MNLEKKRAIAKIKENKKKIIEYLKIASEPFPSTAPGCLCIDKDGSCAIPSMLALQYESQNDLLMKTLRIKEIDLK